MERRAVWFVAVLLGAVAFSAVVPERAVIGAAWAANVAKARSLVEQQRYEEAIALIQQELRGKVSYGDLQELKALLDQALFGRAEQANTAAGWEEYLRVRPDGANSAIARQRLCSLSKLTFEQQKLCDGQTAPVVAQGQPMLPSLTPSRGAASAWPSVDDPLKTGQKSPADAAVVVGNEDYAFLPDVPYARADAVAVYQWLVYGRGVPTESASLLDGRASREMILQATEAAIKRVGPGGTLWFYFSGHGAASPQDSSRLLLGDDARSEMTGFESRAVRVAELRAMAEAAKIRAVFILDTCYSGTGRGGETLLAGRRIAVPAWALEPPEAQIVEWSAAGPDQLSGPIPAARHGAFTWFVLGSMRGWADGAVDGQRDGTVTAAEADAYVRRGLSSVGIVDQAPIMVAANPGSWQFSTAASEAGPDLAKLRLSGLE